MLQRLIISAIVLSTLIGLAGCGVQVPAGCNRVTFGYPSPGAIPVPIPYTVLVYIKGTATVIGKHTSTVAESGETVTIPLNKSYPVGTRFTVEIFADILGSLTPIGSFSTNACAGSVESWFDPGDARINRQAYAGAVVYCDADEKRVGIYGVNQDNAQGFPAIFIPYDQLPPVPPAEAGHTLIASYGNIRFYRLTTGEYQINVGPDAEGKEYVAVWDGCPQTVVTSYIFQGGTQTMTEIYPHD